MTGPRMRGTRWTDLAAPFVVVGVLAYIGLRFSYDTLPPLQYVVPVPIAVLASVEYLAARRVRAAVRHEPHARPMAAIAVARCVALGKASSLVGAAVAGASVALLAWVLPDVRTVRAAENDAKVAGVLLVATVLLVVAGVILERSGIDPGHDRRDAQRADRP